ncbi:MAG: dihydroorotase [SAR202 cluster bacterium]|nr:dihydroorotase [SAR202 cluster bacterium]
MTPILISGGRIVDPSQNIDKIADLLIENGVITGIDARINPPAGAKVIDAQRLIVCPGFIDLHCHLREPGLEYKETIASGTLAAARGGFTTLCAMPNTNPVMDNSSIVDFVNRRAKEEGVVRVLPIGAVTKGSKGAELAEMGEMAKSGVIGFSDDGHPVGDANVMRQALSYASGLGLPIINHCEVKELSGAGVMNEGWVATRLGLRGIPRSSEEAMAARDVSLAEITGGRLHVAHASTSGTVEIVKRAKERGLSVTCEVTPHHLTLPDETVLGYANIGKRFDPLTTASYDTSARVSPPLRGREDVAAMVKALKDGVVDFIATDHAPHSRTDKQCTFDEAANGISNLETTLGLLMTLVHSGGMPLPLLIEKLTVAPAKFLGRNLGTLKAGAPADVTIFDPDAEWKVDAKQFASKGKNTPLDGATLKGKVAATVYSGQVVFGG